MKYCTCRAISLSIWILAAQLGTGSLFAAGNDAGTNDSGEETAVAPAPAAPVLAWTFDDEKSLGTWVGSAAAGAEGPRPPRYPGFAKDNGAAFFTKPGDALVIKDQEKGGPLGLRFAKGESITMEAWIKIDALSKGSMVYVIGKGRHGKLGENLGEMNQNYAMRLQGTDGGAKLGFLFTSEDSENPQKREWHRWWSEGEITASGWHHLAIVYTFGNAKSLRAYLDGEASAGVWDMGGATDRGPVSDADDLVIGTGYKRSRGESFSGWLDEVKIHRAALPAAELQKRYLSVPPPPAITREMVPQGKVFVQIAERGVPGQQRWPEETEVTETYEEEAFGLFALPQKYIGTGVRADRANPSLVRASALVALPKGTHRLLLRGRGAAKLFVDGREILMTPFPSPDTGGHGVLSAQETYLDLGPDFRFAPPGNREKWIEFESDGQEHLVVLETILGGIAGKSKRRPELGETVVAVSLEGTDTWKLLSPGERAVDYTDAGWLAYETERRARLDQIDAAAREACREEHAAYWEKRRLAASQWLATQEEIAEPASDDGSKGAIDRFLEAKIKEVADLQKSARSGSVDYHKEIRPLLEAKCYSCHQGGKVKGDLRLDVAELARQGGENDGPAIVPGDVAKSALLHRISEDAGDDIMPPKGNPLTSEEIGLLTRWIEEGAIWPQFAITNFDLLPLTDDHRFLRRLALDTVGVPPSEEELATFLAADPAIRRVEAIDRYLADARWADRWMGYWQDVLAENPNIINPTLNNTGPFRWWLHESLLDNKPLDLMVTELIRMEGSERFGGPAGFATASQNDVPMAAKGIILAEAFLGIEMKCARCHDSPTHVSKQEDLFQLAAMLAQKPLQVPTTSSVPMDKLHAGGRKPLIEVTLAPGSEVSPAWPLADFCSEENARALAADPNNSRDLLAAFVTSPENERFAQVMANRIWERFMGRGIVSSLADWEKSETSHPELLQWLARRLVASGYDTKELSRLILQSDAYQREVDIRLTSASPLFINPAPRRLDAEQIVDSLFSATGKPFSVEEVSLDIDSVRAMENSITLGKPRRAWMLASTSNERDRPSLSLPRIQAVSSLLETFGWRGARQDTVQTRDQENNVLQPAILANGVVATWLTRLSDDHGITQLALEEQSLEALLDRLYQRLLTRDPSQAERDKYLAYLTPGYESRALSPVTLTVSNEPRRPARYVTWSNHLDGAANTLAQEHEEAARLGDPPTELLDADWRTRLEDVLWAMLNSPEWIYRP